MARRCSSCSTDNPEGARFCMNCGTALARPCEACGSENPPGARFCMNCGAALEDAAPPQRPGPGPGAPAPRAQPVVPLEERRVVSVLFADLSGYTAVAETMDPEALKGLVERCLHRLGEEVDRHGGTVDKYIGDNIMALFGAPVAHDNDPERAVRAGLAMQAAMDELNTEQSAVHGLSFALRIGVNSGEVAAGAVGDGYTVIGDTVNVAARLQAAARPGSVTVGARTWRATRDVIDYRQLEPLNLKGKAQAVPAWEAGAVLRAPSSGERRPTPFVGRDDELDLLESLYGRVVREGRPHLVTLVGQAGVGKSRILRELEARLAARPDAPASRHGRSLPYGSGIVYWALGEVIRAEADILDEDSSVVAWGKLSAAIERTVEGQADRDEPTERRAALIGRLVGIEAPPDVPVVEVDDPQEMRERFFSAARSLVEGLTRRGPLVIAWEDVHWADEGMLDLIEYLAQWVKGPLLVLALTREELLERRPSWGGGRGSASSIFLAPLAEPDTRALVAALMDDERPAPETVALVAARAGGNPLFAEEMARSLVEEEGSDATELPDTVHAVLASRLDALAPLERRVVQDAAVVGERFWTGALERLLDAEPRRLRAALSALEAKDIVVAADGPRRIVSAIGMGPGDRELSFKHVLIRDVAYGTLPKALRSEKHFTVGSLIEEQAGDRAEEVVALVAEHYGRAATLAEEAGVPEQRLSAVHERALRSLEAAGDAAGAVHSMNEAMARFRAALELRGDPRPDAAARIGEKLADLEARAGRLDEAVARWTRALAHHQAAGDTLRVAALHRKIGAALWHGGDRDGAIEHYQAGINLLRDGEPCVELVELYEEAATLYLNTGDNMLAVYASERALRLAERLAEPRVASRAYAIFGRVFGRIGDQAKARENLERSVELSRGLSPDETVRALLALGDYLDVAEADYGAAQRAWEEALAIAQEIGDLPDQVELTAHLALIAAYRTDWATAEALTATSTELAEREGMEVKLALPYGLNGLLLWKAGDLEGAARMLRRAHDLATRAGWSEIEFSTLIGLSMVLRDGGDPGGAVAALETALEVCERAGLVAQSIQAMSARAIDLALAGRADEARAGAQEALALAERLPYRAGRAAAAMADGATREDPEEATGVLREAAAGWRALERVGEALYCELLIARATWSRDPVGARAVAESALASLGRHGMASSHGPVLGLLEGPTPQPAAYGAKNGVEM
jgi:class 3 adenylate cyclase/tetratricopeptide (TPR) repeat protein